MTERATLAEVARVMCDANCGFLPVVGSGDGKLCGVITDRDVCMGAFTQTRTLDEIPVAVSMWHDVAACKEEDDLARIELVMRDRRVRRLPVIDEENRPAGVVSLDDLARVVLDPDVGRERQHLAEDVARTLGLVSQPAPFQELRAVCR